MANPTLSQVFAGLLQIAQERDGLPRRARRLVRLHERPVAPHVPHRRHPGRSPRRRSCSSTSTRASTHAGQAPADDRRDDPAGRLRARRRPRRGAAARDRPRAEAPVRVRRHDRRANDANGAPLGVATALAPGAHVDGHDRSGREALLASSLPALTTAGVDATQVAAATVFTTGDVVDGPVRPVDEGSRARTRSTSPTSRSIPTVLDTNDRFCELQAQVTYPQFQVGIAAVRHRGALHVRLDGDAHQAGRPDRAHHHHAAQAGRCRRAASRSSSTSTAPAA